VIFHSYVSLPEGNRQELGLTSKQWWNMRNSPATIVKNGDWTIEPTKIGDFNWDFTKPSPMEFNAIYPLVIHFGSYGTWSTNGSMICPPGMLHRRIIRSFGAKQVSLKQPKFPRWGPLHHFWANPTMILLGIYIYARYCIVLYWSYVYIYRYRYRYTYISYNVRIDCSAHHLPILLLNVLSAGPGPSSAHPGQGGSQFAGSLHGRNPAARHMLSDWE